ncbi:MAG: hypothetical protein HFI99_01790 [Lachnospiraceae bacterium]|jgi:chromosome segregation ATPase|nr:hypothetical protein [Lachnospiraceae bacterium]MCI9326359.1 hypothetical protein [Lachnospiraceae bacterium]
MERNEEYGVETFRTAVFGGFRKNEVLEYLDSLMAETEQLRKSKKELELKLEDRESKLEQERRRAEEMEKLLGEADKEMAEVKELFDELDAQAEENNRLNTELDTRNGECDKLKTELNAQIKECDNLKCELQELWKERTDNKQLQEEYERLLQEKKLQEQSLAGRKPQIENSETKIRYKELCRELEERINDYDKRKNAVSDVLVNARMEAEQILAEANSRATFTLRQAERQKQAAEAMVQRFATQNIGQMKLIKQQLEANLDILSSVYQGVEQARTGLNQSVIGIPDEVEALQRIVEGEIVLESDSYIMDDMP